MSNKQTLFIFNFNCTFLEINLAPNETFERTFDRLIPGKKYGMSGYFYWNQNNPDGSVTKTRLSKSDSPSSLHMDIRRPQVLEWKQAVVWTMFRK